MKNSYAIPALGAVPLPMVFIGAAASVKPMGYGPGQIHVARQGDGHTPAVFSVEHERADHPEVRALIDALDAYQSALYPATSKQLTAVDAPLAPPLRLLVVRDAHRRVLACAALQLHEDYAELKRMMVYPAQRGLGLAKRLLAALEREAALAGRPLLRLEIGLRQPAAIQLYTRMGFTPCGPFGAGVAGPLSVFMEKLLG